MLTQLVRSAKLTKKRTESDALVVQKKKLFVLDTNVFMEDATSLFKFEEHDLYVPMITLAELDKHKKGRDEINWQARATSRYFDTLTASEANIEGGIPLSGCGHKDAQGRLFFQTTHLKLPELPLPNLPGQLNDNDIIGITRYLKDTRTEYEDVVLVSKDINVRIKARAVGLNSETYHGDKEIEDDDILPDDFIHRLPSSFWETLGCEVGVSPSKEGDTYIFQKTFRSWTENDLVILPGKDADNPLEAIVTEKNKTSTTIRVLTDYRNAKSIWGIYARSREQNLGLNLLMDNNVDIVSLAGKAGTGKTMLTLASALEQTMEMKRYNEIFISRAPIPIGPDMGFLPGNEEEKMEPWMGALHDNLDVLMKNGDAGEKGSSEWAKNATRDLLKQRIKIKSMNFMRGRNLVNKFFIIDEAQNLTQKQVKSLITRAGQGTKVVLLGNVSQIDSPYLSASDCGLVRVIHAFRKHFKHAGYVLLDQGERSRLAEAANAYL